MNNYEEELKKDKRIINVRKEDAEEGFKDDVEVYSIRYISGIYEVEGYALFPKNKNDQLYGLIYNRGGNREFGAIKNTILLCKLAKAGYAVLASQYRGNCGGTGKEEFGGDDVYDVINLIDITLDLSFVNSRGVYMIGASRGGMMTYRVCSIDKRIIAAVVISGFADCIDNYNSREDSMKKVFHELVGGSPTECPEEFIKRSAVYGYTEKVKDVSLMHFFHNKLIKLGSNMNTSTAQRIAENRINFVKNFIGEFIKEWNSEI